jgi:Protein of unknown function (DUF3341)
MDMERITKMSKKITSIIAEFKSTKEILQAAAKTRKAGFKKFETYTPFPIHGMDDAMGLTPSKLPWVVLFCGLLGCAFGFGLQTWVATSAYKLTISGKPFFSYQAFVPVTFELTILFSAFGTVFGMLAFNKLPQWYHSLFTSRNFSKSTSEAFFLEIQSQDPLFDIEKTPQFLESLGGRQVEVIKENE